MDLTYRPFIRDSIISDITVDIPTSDITPYRPKYNTDNQSSTEDEEEQETPVQSQIEEVNTATQQNPTTYSSYKSKFSSKEDFKNTMLPIYESILVKKGLNPLFAKALVAQDALESAWGTKESGRYNLGGIKGKGTVRRTREVINGKDVYINDSFRDFNSLEDYANYKVNLLNNNRYRAFSGNVSEFANRVHRGGYATDPNYSKILNQVIASVKRGGKFQEGGIIEGKEWLKNWYGNRKSLLKQNIQQNQIIPFPVTESLAYNLMAKNMDLTSASINPSKLPDNADGLYNKIGRRIYLRTDTPSIAVHEWTHSSGPSAQIREIDKIKDTLGDTIYDQKSIIPNSYLDRSSEIYARLMQLRHALNIDPNHKFTNEEIESLKNRFTKSKSLTTRLQDKNGNKDFTVTTFDKNNNVLKAQPLNPDFKPIFEESRTHTEYDTDNTYDILNRYSTNFIKTLLNDIAKDKNHKDLSLYVKKGAKLSTGIVGDKIIKSQKGSNTKDWNSKGILINEYNNPEEYYDYSNGKYNHSTNHWLSREPKTGLVLKNPKHPTAFMSYDTDSNLGYNWYKGYDGRIYSKQPWENVTDLFTSKTKIDRDEINHPVSIKGFKNIKEVYNYLRSLGANEKQAAGLTGVFIQESGLKHDKVSSAGAEGIAQLKEDKLNNYKKWLGNRPNTWQNQLTWLWDHINNGNDNWQLYYNNLKNRDPKLMTDKERKDWESMKNSKWVKYSYENLRNSWNNLNDPGDIAELFTWTFERPTEQEAKISQRRDYAQQVYNLLNN